MLYSLLLLLSEVVATRVWLRFASVFGLVCWLVGLELVVSGLMLLWLFRGTGLTFFGRVRMFGGSVVGGWCVRLIGLRRVVPSGGVGICASGWFGVLFCFEFG